LLVEVAGIVLIKCLAQYVLELRLTAEIFLSVLKRLPLTTKLHSFNSLLIYEI